MNAAPDGGACPRTGQALLVLAHLRCGHTYAQLAAGFGVGTSTVYRYFVEAADLLATRTSDLVGLQNSNLGGDLRVCLRDGARVGQSGCSWCGRCSTP